LKNGSPPLKNLFRFKDVRTTFMIKNKPLSSVLERRKTFDSPLANHFSPVMQGSRTTSFKTGKS
jgi:hypothetical protein